MAVPANELMARRLRSITLQNAADLLKDLSSVGEVWSEGLASHFRRSRLWPPLDFARRFSTDEPEIAVTYMWAGTSISEILRVLTKRFGSNARVWIDVLLNDQRSVAAVAQAVEWANEIYMNAKCHVIILSLGFYSGAECFPWDRCWIVNELVVRDRIAVQVLGKSKSLVVLPEDSLKALQVCRALGELLWAGGCNFLQQMKGKPEDVLRIRHNLLTGGYYISEMDFNQSFFQKLQEIYDGLDKVSTLKGHIADVQSVSWCPGGDQIVAGAGGSSDNLGELIVWDAKTGDKVLTLNGHAKSVRSVAWRPGGDQIASASEDETIIIWDAKTGKQVSSLKGHGSNITCVAWRPGGDQIASGSWDQSIIIWDAKTEKQVSKFLGHTGPVTSVTWRPGGDQIASASWDNTIIIWDAKTGQQVSTLNEHTDWVKSVAWRPAGDQIVSGCRNTITIWDAKTGEQISILRGHTNSVNCVVWSPGGDQIASGSFDSTIIIWDAKTAQQVSTLKGHNGSVTSVAWRPGGDQIASGSCDKTIIIWDAKAGPALKGHSCAQRVAFRPSVAPVQSIQYDVGLGPPLPYSAAGGQPPPYPFGVLQYPPPPEYVTTCPPHLVSRDPSQLAPPYGLGDGYPQALQTGGTTSAAPIDGTCSLVWAAPGVDMSRIDLNAGAWPGASPHIGSEPRTEPHGGGNQVSSPYPGQGYYSAVPSPYGTGGPTAVAYAACGPQSAQYGGGMLVAVQYEGHPGQGPGGGVQLAQAGYNRQGVAQYVICGHPGTAEPAGCRMEAVAPIGVGSTGQDPHEDCESPAPQGQGFQGPAALVRLGQSVEGLAGLVGRKLAPGERVVPGAAVGVLRSDGRTTIGRVAGFKMGAVEVVVDVDSHKCVAEEELLILHARFVG